MGNRESEEGALREQEEIWEQERYPKNSPCGISTLKEEEDSGSRNIEAVTYYEQKQQREKRVKSDRGEGAQGVFPRGTY